MGDGKYVMNVNIKDVIQDRKAQRKLKAEQKRQVDMQRIMDMRSVTGIDPLQRFPKEIWSMIVEELSPEDRYNVWKVHPLFRDLMERTRISDILFPQVLKVYAFRNSVKRKSFQNLRRVSKSLRDSFDLKKEETLAERVQGPLSDNYSRYDYDVNFLFGSKKDRQILDRLLASYVGGDDHSGKRFFPRALAVCISEEDMYLAEEEDIAAIFDQFKKDISALLKHIGGQIWHLKFCVQFLEKLSFSFADVYTLLQEWISLMPNLKWLDVAMEWESTQGIGMDEKTAILLHGPFPHLIHLERLSLYSTETDKFHDIHRAVLAANQHIKMLDLSEWDAKTSVDGTPYVPPHLTQSLQLTAFSVFDHGFWNESTCLQAIIPFVNFNWPLQTIVLKLIDNPKGHHSLNDVFRFLEKFPTLENVMLEQLEEFEIGHTENIGYLGLPNLMEFKLKLTSPEIKFDTNIQFILSLQFLLNCKNLQTISWGLSRFDYDKLWSYMFSYESGAPSTVLDFRAGLRYLYDSNIWDVFPSLQSIDVVFCKRINSRACSHAFFRCDIEGMTATKFMKSHVCFRRRKETIRGGVWACVMCNII